VQARIKEKREVATRTLMVVFDLLGQEVDYRPGQYFWVTLVDPPYDDEKGTRRHITAVTSPNDRGVLGLCTRLRDSAFKRSLAELPVGAAVDVEEPKGDFILPEDTDQPYAFIAGGIGITVFRSMLRYIAEENLAHRVTLVYSNRDRDSAAFLDELLELERANPNLRLVPTMTDDPAWEGEARRIDADLLRDHLGDDLGLFTYLVAGPPSMVEAIVKELETAGVRAEQIRPERFSGY
jgi:ferredoxin-NADP reductase